MMRFHEEHPSSTAVGIRYRNGESGNPAAERRREQSSRELLILFFIRQFTNDHTTPVIVSGRVQIFITERIVDQIAEGVDLAFRVGELEDSSLVARRILTYRHQLVASPAYLDKRTSPVKPQDLLDHRLLAFHFWRPENSWKFTRANGEGLVKGRKKVLLAECTH
jgi:DNA-binding transcriptional LysR family regulator